MSQKGSGVKQCTVVVIGEGGVGKTAIVNRFVYNQFVMEYDPTLEDTHRKQCVIDEEMMLVEVVDPNSRETYRARNYWYNFVKAVDGVILVYSIGSRFTFDAIRGLYQVVLERKKQDLLPLHIVLLANKSDVTYERQVNTSEGEELAKELGCCLFEASAKTGKNIDEAVYELIRMIQKGRKTLVPPPDTTVLQSNGCCSGCVVL